MTVENDMYKCCNTSKEVFMQMFGFIDGKLKN
jgi:hypothetical protein